MKADIITIGQVLLLLLLLPRCNILTNAMSAGYTAKEGEFPSFVGLKGIIPSKPDSEQICGGSLVSNDTIVTAGQCFLDESYQIYAAPSIYHPDLWKEKDVETYEVVKRCLPDDFSMPKSSIPSHPSNDYQILRLKTPILGLNYSRIPKFEMARDQAAKAVGLGSLHNGKNPTSLQVVYVVREVCEGGSSSELDLCFDAERNNGHTCMGDVGSPAYVKTKGGHQVLVGIASTPFKECSRKEREQSVYTSVHKALDGLRKLKKECLTD